MSSQKISNEMIYELLKQQQLEIHALRDDLQDFKADMREFKRDTHLRFEQIDQHFKEVRADIANLKQNKISWNAGLVAGIVAMSSVTTLILIRLLTTIGIKIADTSLPLL